MNATIETNASHTRALEKRPEGKEAQAHDADVALDLQRQYDQEDQHLQQQYRFLKDTAPAIFKCAICLERYQEDFVVRLMPCGHMFCRGWARRSSELDVESLQQLGLTEKQYERYNEMQLARFSTIVHCQKRVASCKRTIFVDKREYQQTSEVVCPFPKCGYAWCKMCSQALDPSGPKHSCDGSSELRHLMGERGWKACPGCDTPTEKTGGCNHMTCMSPACNTHFCYLCGKLIVKTSRRSSLKSALAKHYRKCTLFEYR
ncbi:uncharacterized protein BXZ73DRAFT_107363 [Epithele typhae]|uniref:uncharacterized protein n=1 Tax=Epithele typhae TaxID=378194 RepID=UPI0020077467|nr:uncharacterized protein BXZ73DRAFT_107363 [Epithele typhae]KAH9912633.1 hypothetical protein BXZ73DRAFT_107363 [Epithele typhae]